MTKRDGLARNIALYPWFKFFQNLIFWQAVWFLFFQSRLSAAEAILLYAVYDLGTLLLEVPSGVMSDRLGRRKTLIAAAVAGGLGAALLAVGDGFVVFALAQLLLGTSIACASGTDNALLYESLAATGRADEIETQETRGWQFSLSALALSAFLGGVVAQASFVVPFAGAALAMAAALVIAWRFTEPPHDADLTDSAPGRGQIALLRRAMAQPVLVWLLVLSMLMYGFSHIPFVFGQPFIAEALRDLDWSAEAPAVSGTVSALMMVVSVLASLVALAMRRRLGLAGLLMLSFGMQIALIAVLAMTNSVLAIAVLFLRMVPNSWSRPFIVARIQPLLSDAGRATYLSVQSLGGRVLFSATLLAVSQTVPSGDVMAYADIRQALTWYTVAGLVCLAGLAATVRRAGVSTPARTGGAELR